MIRFDNPLQWARTERAPLPVLARVQPRATRLMRQSLAAAPTLPMPLLAQGEPWRDTRGEIHDTRPDIFVDGPVRVGPRPMPIVERCEPGTIITDEQAEIMAARAEGARMQRCAAQRKHRPIDGRQVGEVIGNIVGWPIAVLAVVAIGSAVARWLL